MSRSSDLWSPQMRKWYSDAGKHGVKFMMSESQRRYKPGGQSASGSSGGGGGQAQTMLNWTSQTTAYSLEWESVCWAPSLGLFAAVSASETGTDVMTSPDGVNWTSRTTPNTGQNWIYICWSPTLGKFCAVSDAQTGSDVMTSSDGITWTPRTTPNSGQGWISVCWSTALSLFVAVSYTSTGSDVMTSPNGTTWTPRTTPNTLSQVWITVAASSTNVVALSSAGTVLDAMSSPDGITWTAHATPSGSGWDSVAYNSLLGLYCGVSSSTQTTINSTNGLTWSSSTTPGDIQSWTSVCAAKNVFAAVSVEQTNYDSMLSIDGSSWTLWSTPIVGWSSVCYSPDLNLLVSVSSNAVANNVMTSPL